jgi:hypothetical protein
MKHTLLFCLCISLSATATAQAAPGSPARVVLAAARSSVKVVEGYGKLPLAFEANQGQAGSQVKFLSRGAGYSLFFTPTEAVLALQPSDPSPAGSRQAITSHQPSVKWAHASGASQHSAVGNQSLKTAVLRMKLVGANAKAKVIGQNELPGKSNYFIGNDPQKWHTNVPQYAKVRYENVYPSVDLVYYGHQRELEYDFVLRPGANPRAIRLRITGAKRLRPERGELVLISAAGDIRLRSPHIYQESNGVRQEVGGRYVITSKNGVGFRVGAYDRRRTLVIDPVLAYSTYLAGSAHDGGAGIAVDSAGNAYVVGTTEILFRHKDAFVNKVNSDGSALLYSTYLGGGLFDFGDSIAVDSAGNAYVCGFTDSTDFPTANALQPTLNGGFDAFVTKINTNGSALVYSTYLGGSNNNNYGNGIAVDSAGNAYVAGLTGSAEFPTKNAIQPVYGGNGDAFVTKINAKGSALVYSTYLGGSQSDEGMSVAVDSAGKAYVTGGTDSTDFPTKNAIQPVYGGNGDAFVTKINANGSALVYSTYLGGSHTDSYYGVSRASVAVDSAGNAYVSGSTQSTDFPTANAIQPSFAGRQDAFVTKFNSDGSALLYSTYLGRGGYEIGAAIAVDTAGNAYVTGTTFSTDFPTVNPIQSGIGGGGDAFVTEFNPQGNALVYSTYLGGPHNDYGSAITVDAAGSAYLTGTASTGFPETPVAFERTPIRYKQTDAFVAKIVQQTFVSVSAAKLNLPTALIGTTSPAKKITVTNTGTGTLPINKIYVGGLDPGEFAETDTCDSSLAAGASCTVSVTFTPTEKNKRQAGLGISTTDPASPDAVALIGTGTVVSLSMSKLSFGDQAVGTTSPPQTVTLKNVDPYDRLNFSGINIIGTKAGDFSETNTCGTSIAGGASCTITVTFTPTAQGTRKAAVRISDDGGGSPQKVTLTGTGT